MKKILKNISPFNNKTDMPNILFVIKKILAFWFCYIAGLFIAEGFAILLHFAMGKNMLVGEVFDDRTIQLIIYYGYIVVIAIALLYWKFIEKKPITQIGFNKKIGNYFIGAVVGVLILLISVIAVVITGSIEYHGIFDNINVPVLLLFVGGFVIQGAMEEVLCRGLVLQSLKDKVSLPIAIAVSTVMFILPHSSSLFSGEIIYSVIGIVNLILISIIFSLFTIKFNNIWVACGLHSFWNLVLYNVLGLNLSGTDEATAIFNMQSVGDNILNGSFYGIEASIITTVVLGAFTATFLLLDKKKNIEKTK
ncbi:MAG: type II CAAX endopeptidase family protein [Acutalibacteraceae bacterium]|nr:type II CAAX endopeptidase family protein [Acutalibacteraceae bacterium]